MEAVEYLKEKQRMCAFHQYCIDCPISNLMSNTSLSCKKYEEIHPEQAVQIVEKWAKEHPVKTYLSVLLEKFPNAELYDKNTTPTVCLTRIFGEKHRTNYRNCEEITCKECWNREYKESKDGN